MKPMVQVTPDLDIPEEELVFTTSRSGGPGGQNVNKVNTRVSLLFDVERSPSLSTEVRDRLRDRLSARLSRQGTLRLTSQRFRSQHANKEAVVRRFVTLLQQALQEPAERIPTETPPEVIERRLEKKRRRSETKRERRVVPDMED